VNVERAVRDFLRTELGKAEDSVGPEESLLESGTIDSMGVLQLVSFIEKTYGIKVEDDDLMPENFDTIAAIVSFIERRQAGARG
jgi:acyl carrier protein